MFPNFPENNKDDDFLNEFRQKLNDQSIANFEEKKNEINRSKNVFIGAVSGIALAAVVGWFVLSPRYANDPNVELPVIRRPQTAVKVQPTEPDGMEILNQDKSVYDIIEKKDNNAPLVENLLPPPEEPQLPVIAAQPQPAPAPTPAPAEPDTTSVVLEKAEGIIKVAEAPKAVPAIEPKPEPENVPLGQLMKKAPLPAPQPEPVKEIAPKREAVNIVIPAKETVKVDVDQTPSTSTGPWCVQLMSSPNQTAVNGAWKGLVKKYNVLQKQPHEVETADLGSKGTYYRLYAGAFADRSGADRLCNDIKALGGTCIVKKK